MKEREFEGEGEVGVGVGEEGGTTLREGEKGNEQEQTGGGGKRENSLSIFHLPCVAHLSARRQGGRVLTARYWLIHIAESRRWLRPHGGGRMWRLSLLVK